MIKTTHITGKMMLCASAVLCVLVAAGIFLAQPEPANAWPGACPKNHFCVEVGGGSGKRTVECLWNAGKPTTSLVDCVSQILDNIGDTFIIEYSKLVGPMISGAAALAVFFLGVKIILGGAHVRSETWILLMKLVFIFYFSLPQGVGGPGINEWRPYITHATIDLGNMVTAAYEGTGTEFQESAGGNMRPRGIFEALDSMILHILGLDPKNNKPFFFGALVIVAGLFFTGPLGAMIALFVLGMVITLIAAVVQVVYIFMLSMVALTFLFAISPTIIVLILFPVTKRIFEEWVGNVLNYVLEPVILTVFLVMTLNVLTDITTRLDEVYEKAYKVLQDENKPSEIVIMKVPEFLGKINPLISRPDVPHGDLAFSTAMTSQINRDQFVWRKKEGELIGGTLVGGGIVLDKIDGISAGDIAVPYIDLDSEDIRTLLFTFGASFVLLIVMVSFMRKLPLIVNNLVGNRLVTPLATFSTPVTQGRDMLINYTEKASTSVRREMF